MLTLARSTGAVIKVVGMAERNPAAANSEMESRSDVRFGVKAMINVFDVLYAYFELIKNRE